MFTFLLCDVSNYRYFNMCKLKVKLVGDIFSVKENYMFLLEYRS